MYNFIYYLIRYTLVRNLNKLLKPKTLITIAIIILVCFLIFKSNNSYAVYIGDDTYTDPNNSIYLAYNQISNDFIYKFDNLKDDNNYDYLYECLKNSTLGYYLYYGDFNGMSMIGSTTYNQDTIYIAFYNLSDPSMSSSVYDSYQGLQCTISYNTHCLYVFGLSSNGISFYNNGYYSVYMPSVLYNYRTDLITTYLFNDSQQQNQAIVDALEQQTNSINEQTEYLQEQPITSDFSQSDLPSDNTTDITLNGLNDIFSMFYNAMTKEPSSSDNITITIPFTSKSFVIPYNYTSVYVPTIIKSLITSFWYFTASVFIIKDIIGKFDKLKSGNIENIQTSNIKGDIL